MGRTPTVSSWSSAAAAVALAAVLSPSVASQQAPASPTPLKLAVILVVDQMRAEFPSISPLAGQLPNLSEWQHSFRVGFGVLVRLAVQDDR